MESGHNAIIYLIHFDEPYLHAKHYMGSTLNLHSRLSEHALGEGARLMKIIKEAGITWQLVRIWEGARQLERLLKDRKDAPRLCPCCQGEAAYNRARYPDLNKISAPVQLLRIEHPSEGERLEDYYERRTNIPWVYWGEEENQVRGEWFGKLAKDFDLKGEVDQKSLYRLVDGKDPHTGQQLFEDVGPEEYIQRAGLAATFSLPAEISIMAYLSGNEELKQSIWRDHIASVQIALESMERNHAYAIVGEAQREQSGNLIASIHHHEFGGPGDPLTLQVNTRVAIMNMTRGGDGNIHALSENELLDSKAEAISVYYEVLADKLNRRGIEVTLSPETNAPKVEKVTRRYIEAVSPILTYTEADRIRHPIHVLVARKEMGPEARKSASEYIAGQDILFFPESSATYGIERGEYGQVTEIDSETNTLTLQLAGGREVNVDPRRLYAIVVLKEAQRYFAPGDRMEFGSPFGGEAVTGALATIERIEGKNFFVRLENGQEVNVDTEKFIHFDKVRRGPYEAQFAERVMGNDQRQSQEESLQGPGWEID